MSKKKIAVLVGSLRKESVNRKLANELVKLAPESLELEIVEMVSWHTTTKIWMRIRLQSGLNSAKRLVQQTDICLSLQNTTEPFQV